ncbi:MAG TPA: LamG-like jellyroll fold domain-containing protein, partial [Bacteroidia bacterium]|jgi:hypothetical protein|nr:LamG-like jellyroll fold domain-containing protein [Bacteroidia bacterium]
MKKKMFSVLALIFFGSISYGQHHPSDQDTCLISKYYFNSGTVNDDYGPNNGTQVGATLVPDRFGNANAAWYLNGNQYSYLNFGTYAALKPNDISVSMWFNVTAPTFSGSGYTFNPLLLTKCQTGNNCFEAYCLYYDFTSNKIATACTDTNFCFQPGIFTSAPVPSGSWHHIVFTYDNNTITLYLDAVSQGTVSKGFSSLYLGSDSVMVGNSANVMNDRYFNGIIDDVRFYHCVIPQSAVTTLYNEPNWFVPTDVKAISSESKINIYPNPFYDKIKVTTWIPLDLPIQIFNSIGDLIYTSRLEKGKAEIDLHNQASGIYFIKAGSIIKKIVKE